MVVGCLVLVAVLAFGAVALLGSDKGESSVRSTPAARSADTGSPSPETSARESTPKSSAPQSVAPPPPATVVPGRSGWQGLRTADGWSYEVPKDNGWSSSQDVMAYVDRTGKVLVRATQPSYLRAGACRDARSVARGVVGWATPEAGKTSAEVAKNWATAVAVRDDGSQDEVSRVLTRPIRNSQLEIEHSSVLVRSADATGCLPRMMQVSATSYRAKGGTRTLVIVRDLGIDGAMSTTVKERIVRSVAFQAA